LLSLNAWINSIACSFSIKFDFKFSASKYLSVFSALPKYHTAFSPSLLNETSSRLIPITWLCGGNSFLKPYFQNISSQNSQWWTKILEISSPASKSVKPFAARLSSYNGSFAGLLNAGRIANNNSLLRIQKLSLNIFKLRAYRRPKLNVSAEERLRLSPHMVNSVKIFVLDKFTEIAFISFSLK
jgi:hypothetical protein